MSGAKHKQRGGGGKRSSSGKSKASEPTMNSDAEVDVETAVVSVDGQVLAADSDMPDSSGRLDPVSADEASAAEPHAADRDEEVVEASEPVEESPPAILARVFGRTDVGQIREHNEDNFLIADLTRRARNVADPQRPVHVGPNGLLMAVCDGMGGAAAGEIASQLAVDIVYERMVGQDHASRDGLAGDIVQALETAGLRILDESNANRACRGMGTTATVAALVDDHLLIGQVGDSRAYILRSERLVQVTRDQSLVNQLIEAGQLTEEEAENFEHSNIILQALGTADTVQVDLTYVHLRRGDALLMCSDGLSGMIRDDEIRALLVRLGADPVDACAALIDEANQAGGHDNITVIAAVFDGDGLSPPTPADVASLKYAKYALRESLSRNAATVPQPVGFTSPFDDDPRIEVHGEIEVSPDSSWNIDEAPVIPTEGVPSVSMLLMVGLAVVCIVIAFLVLL